MSSEQGEEGIEKRWEDTEQKLQSKESDTRTQFTASTKLYTLHILLACLFPI